jgi:hypothetical protein
MLSGWTRDQDGLTPDKGRPFAAPPAFLAARSFSYTPQKLFRVPQIEANRLLSTVLLSLLVFLHISVWR